MEVFLMKRSTYNRFKAYFFRFLDKDVPFRQKWAAFWRYQFMLFGLVAEKIKGVDYAMIYQEDNGKEHCGNYTMVPVKVMKRIIADCGDVKRLGFIDVGCGKGFAIKKAHEAGFNVVGGVEYNPHLYGICIKNMERERIDTKYIKNEMAQYYQNYDKFDVFFFNNPFDAVILCDVLKVISKANSSKKIRCYFLNPDMKDEEAFSKEGFILDKRIEDSDEKYFDMDVYVNR